MLLPYWINSALPKDALFRINLLPEKIRLVLSIERRLFPALPHISSRCRSADPNAPATIGNPTGTHCSRRYKSIYTFNC
jgi:hypothetical protein